MGGAALGGAILLGERDGQELLAEEVAKLGEVKLRVAVEIERLPQPRHALTGQLRVPAQRGAWRARNAYMMLGNM